MKRILILTSLLLATMSDANSAEPSSPQDQQVLLAVKEVQAQQAAIAENQAKIDQKLAAAMEAVRVARIYSSRSASGTGK